MNPSQPQKPSEQPPQETLQERFQRQSHHDLSDTDQPLTVPAAPPFAVSEPAPRPSFVRASAQTPVAQMGAQAAGSSILPAGQQDDPPSTLPSMLPSELPPSQPVAASAPAPSSFFSPVPATSVPLRPAESSGDRGLAAASAMALSAAATAATPTPASAPIPAAPAPVQPTEAARGRDSGLPHDVSRYPEPEPQPVSAAAAPAKPVLLGYDSQNSRVAIVQLNRPGQSNALNPETLAQLGDIFARLNADSKIRAVVLTGGSSIFAAGGDINSMVHASAQDIRDRALHVLLQPLTDSHLPIVAAVNGYALGGGLELALMCDIIVAGQSASFGAPEVKVGIMPGMGGTQRLVRAVGKYHAMHLLLTGDVIDAATAHSIGMISRTTADNLVFEEAKNIARKIAKRAPLAVQAVKQTVRDGAEQTLQNALAMERAACEALFDTADQQEGMMAFVERRAPRFTGT